MYRDLVMSGLGGQGVVVSTKLLAEAALDQGYHAVHYAQYGGEVRGGKCECTVIVSDPGETVPSQIVLDPMAVIVVHPESFQRRHDQLRPGGLLLINTSLVKARPSRADLLAVDLPASQIAERVGHLLAANFVILGAFLELTGLVPPEAVLDRLRETLPPYRHHLIEIDRQAMAAGAEFVREQHVDLSRSLWARQPVAV